MRYKGKRVFVTGADGFIGSHLCEALVQEGADVTAFCMYNSQGSLGWLDASPLRKQMRIELGDVRDANSVNHAMRGSKVVFHLAALISVPYSYGSYESYVDTNIRGTMNVLEAAKRLLVEQFVHTSTSEVYGNPEWLPISEAHALNPQSPYAATKAAADHLAMAWKKSFGVPVTILRPFNTYGPRQSVRAIIPTILSQLMSGEKHIQLGRTDTERDFLYVADTVEGFLLAGLNSEAVGQVIHIGTGETISVRKLLSECCDLLGYAAEAVVDENKMRPDASEVRVLQCAPGKAKMVLGWTPQVTLRDGLKRTVEWMEETRQPVKRDFAFA